MASRPTTRHSQETPPPSLVQFHVSFREIFIDGFLRLIKILGADDYDHNTFSKGRNVAVVHINDSG